MGQPIWPIPLIPGIRQDVDRALLPLGSIVDATGVRLRKNAIAKANGMVDAGVTASVGVFSGPCDALGYAAGREVAVMAGRAWARQNTGDTWVETGRASRARPVKAHWGAFTDAASGVIHSACAAIGDYVATAHYDGDGVQVAVMDPSGLRRAAGTFFGNDRPRLFAVGSTFVLTMRDISTGELIGATINSTTLAISGGSLFSTQHTAGQIYDTAPFNSTHFLCVRRTAATTIRVSLFALNFTESAFQTVACFDNDVTAASVYGTDGENIFATFSQTAASVQQIAAFAEDLSSTIFAPTNFQTNAPGSTPAVMTRRDATSVWLVFEEIFNSPTRYQTRVRAYDTSLGLIPAANAYVWHTRIASRPWAGDTSQMSIWLQTDCGATWRTQRRYTLVTLSMDEDVPSSFGMFLEPEFSPDERSNEQQSFHPPEVAFRASTRGYFPALATIRTRTPTSAGTAALVVYEWETEAGFDGRGRQVGEVGGLGVVFGGGLQELPSSRINPVGLNTIARGSENGFMYAPAILSATPVNGGSLTTSALYQFVAVFEYVTPDGLRTRSAPSNIATATPSGTDLSVELEISTAPTTEREFSSPPNRAVVHVYGTVGNGNTFQRLTGDAGLTPGVGDSANGIITFTATTGDATTRTHEPVYTDVGGTKANQPAPAHRFGWVGAGRPWVGGLFNPQIVECGKPSVPNEPAQFTRHGAFRCLLPEACTGGAWLDNATVLFTLTGIYLVPGTGPEANGSPGVATPQRLPSTVGCIDFRSIVEMPAGLGFQSRRGYEILPRGFGEPRLISSPVQDALRGRRVISATVTGHAGADFADAERLGERLLVLSAIDPTLSGDPGVRLVFDLDAERWISIDPAFADSGSIGEVLTTWDGRLVAASRTGTNIRIEDPTDWGSVEDVPMAITVADARPFGIMSRGTVKRFQLLGEFRAESTLTTELYVDGHYSDPTELDEQTLHDELGDKFLCEWEMPERDVNALGWRFSVSSATDEPNEGVVLLALGLEGDSLTGRPQVGAERRA